MRFPARFHRIRRGVASVEMAILLPFLAFIFLVTVDYARVYFQAVVLEDAARAGAIYGAQDPTHAADTTGIQNAVLANATDLNPAPTVSSTTGTDASGNQYVQVTATWTFKTVSNFPGIPNPIVLTRVVQARVAPVVPKNS
jgi:Flp pilus assembly protein TadG